MLPVQLYSLLMFFFFQMVRSLLINKLKGEVPGILKCLYKIFFYVAYIFCVISYDYLIQKCSYSSTVCHSMNYLLYKNIYSFYATLNLVQKISHFCLYFVKNKAFLPIFFANNLCLQQKVGWLAK